MRFQAVCRKLQHSVHGGFIAVVAALIGLTSCAIVAPHQFAEPTAAWQVRSGQLLYRTATNSLIGDVFVRYSNAGDFELRFSKGPGVSLLVLRQDAQFAQVNGALAGKSWTGTVDQTPPQLRGWLGLRDAVLHGPNQQTIRYASSGETFLMRFQ